MSILCCDYLKVYISIWVNGIEQGYSIVLLEGQCPEEFRFSLLQHLMRSSAIGESAMVNLDHLWLDNITALMSLNCFQNCMTVNPCLRIP